MYYVTRRIKILFCNVSTISSLIFLQRPTQHPILGDWKEILRKAVEIKNVLLVSQMALNFNSSSIQKCVTLLAVWRWIMSARAVNKIAQKVTKSVAQDANINTIQQRICVGNFLLMFSQSTY